MSAHYVVAITVLAESKADMETNNIKSSSI